MKTFGHHSIKNVVNLIISEEERTLEVCSGAMDEEVMLVFVIFAD